MENYLMFILNIVFNIIISMITVYIYCRFNVSKIVNDNNNIETQNIINQVVIQYLNEELSSDKINDIINSRIKEVLKDRPRIFTYKNKEEMFKAGLKKGDIAFTIED